MSPTVEIGDQTRRKILAATIALVAEVGWHGVTTRQVAERAGVNNAAVNYHFTTKVELLRTAAVANMEAELGPAMAAMVQAPTLRDGLRLMLTFMGAIDLAQPPMVMLLETMMQASRDAVLNAALRAELATARQQMVDKICADQAAGAVVAAVDALAAATALAALLDGLLLHRMVDPAVDLTRAGLAAIDAILRKP